MISSGPRSGTDSFKRLYKDAFALMEKDPGNAASYFVMGVVAQAYVWRYEDEAVPVELANHTKERLEGFSTPKYFRAWRRMPRRGCGCSVKWQPSTSLK